MRPGVVGGRLGLARPSSEAEAEGVSLTFQCLLGEPAGGGGSEPM